jgi:hypothetical protein
MKFNNKYSVGKYLVSTVAALLASLLFGLQATAQVVTASRSSSFNYNTQGLLLTETIEPDSPQSCLTTTYSYDGYGNKASISRKDEEVALKVFTTHFDVR